jgi:hypothetical protein
MVFCGCSSNTPNNSTAATTAPAELTAVPATSPSDVTASPAASSDDESADPHQEAVVWPTGSYEPVFGDNITSKFTLTDAQQQLYDTYTKDFNFDISIFKDATPVDTACVFISCGINGLWEGEYNLYYDPESKESYKKENDTDLATRDLRSRGDMANIVFPNLKDGKFTDNGDNTGYIEFSSVSPDDYEKQTPIQMRMNLTKSNDIWMVNFNDTYEYL